MFISIARPVKNSLLDNTPLREVPKLLREKVEAVLSFMQSEGIFQIVDLSSRSTTNVTLSRGGGFIRMDAFMNEHPAHVTQIAEALQMLAWYVEPKFHGGGAQGDFQAQKLCNSCGVANDSGSAYCSSPHCHSVALWKLISPRLSAKQKCAQGPKKVKK